MIVFKKTPSKLVISFFFSSIIFILLIYADVKYNNPLPIEELTYSSLIESKLDDVHSDIFHKVQSGENLSIIFEDYEVPLNTAYKIFNSDNSNLITNLKPGDLMKFKYLNENLKEIEIVKDKVNSIIITVSDEIIIQDIKNEIENIKSYFSGTIQNSFYEDALNQNIPESIIMDFAYIFGWDIDFVFDVRPDDEFFVIFETPYAEGEKVDNGDIIFAKFKNKNKDFFAHRYFVSKNSKEYFDDQGNNVQKAFLRAPLDFAYISSHFNPNRMHPILHKIRAHNGVDYAAKRGSPVRATGDGNVFFIGNKGGCGNEILIKHANNYSTRYCHLEGFEKNIKKGSKIKQGQTIGFVGSSGLATGPHLHYEFKIGDKHTDPVKVKLPSAEPIKDSEQFNFQKVVELNKIELNKFTKQSLKNES